MTRDEAIEKLRKLKALADRAGTPGEAQAALAQMAKIAAQYSIEPSELEVEEQLLTLVIRGTRRSFETWECVLADRIARICGCVCGRTDEGIHIAGRESDKRSAKMLIVCSIDTIHAQCERAKEADPSIDRRSYCLAFADELAHRMVTAQNEVLDAVRTKALVVLTPEERVLAAQAEVDKRYDTNLTESDITIKDATSARLGRADAQKAKIAGEHKRLCH